MQRLFKMSILTFALVLGSLLAPAGDTHAQSGESYVCEFAGYAEVEDGDLVDLQITELECE